MTEPTPDEAGDIRSVDDPLRAERPRDDCRYYIDPQTGFFSILSPPGTPPLTSEDVRKLLEDFP